MVKTSSILLILFLSFCANANTLHQHTGSTKLEDLKTLKAYKYLKATPEYLDSVSNKLNPFSFLQASKLSRLDVNDPLTVHLQEMLNKLWLHLSNRHDLTNIPHPTISIISDSTINAHVSAGFKCIKAKFKIQDVKNNLLNKHHTARENQVLFSDFTAGLPVLSEVAAGGLSTMPNGIPCIESKYPENDLIQFIEDFNHHTNTTCQLNLEKSGLDFIINAKGECLLHNPENLDSLDEIIFPTTANIININAGLLFKFKNNPDEIFSTIAHELAHYLRGHASIGQNKKYADWFYGPNDRAAGYLPPKKAEYLQLGQEARLVGQFPWTHPEFIKADLDPALADKIDSIVFSFVKGRKLNFNKDVCRTLDASGEKVKLGSIKRACLIKCGEYKRQTFKQPLLGFIQQFHKDSSKIPTQKDVDFVSRRQRQFLACIKALPNHKETDLKLYYAHNKSQIFADDFSNRLYNARQSKSAFIDMFADLFNSYHGKFKDMDLDTDHYSTNKLIDFVLNYYKQSRSYLEQAHSQGLKYYSAEQEADELETLWVVEMGLPAFTGEKALFKMNAHREGMQWSLYRLWHRISKPWPTLGDVSYKECKELRENGWRDKNGHNVNLSISEYVDTHHPACYRSYRLSQFISKHLPHMNIMRSEQPIELNRLDLKHLIEKHQRSLPFFDRFAL